MLLAATEETWQVFLNPSGLATTSFVYFAKTSASLRFLLGCYTFNRKGRRVFRKEYTKKFWQEIADRILME
jgi:hypothetical protein